MSARPAGIDVAGWVRSHLATLLAVPASEVDFERTLSDYGLDSFDLMVMAGDAEEALGIEIDPEPFFPPPPIAEVVAILERMLRASAAAGGLAKR